MSDTNVKPAAPGVPPSLGKSQRVREYEERGGFSQHGRYSRVITVPAGQPIAPGAEIVGDDTPLSDWERG